MTEKAPQLEQPSPGFDLEKIFREYNDRMIRTAENELKRQGVRDYETIAQDVVQNVYLSFANTGKAGMDFPQKKSELAIFLNRCVQAWSLYYVRSKARPDPNQPNSYKIRDSHLRPIEDASHVTVEPTQEKVNLRELIALIQSVRNITTKQRKILMARYVEGKTLEEIAADFGLKGHTNVAYYISNALKILRRNPKFTNLFNELKLRN